MAHRQASFQGAAPSEGTLAEHQARIHIRRERANVASWHNPDLRLAVSEGPLTIAFRTLATEGMRPGLQGLTGLYGALVLLARFAGAAGKPFSTPCARAARDALRAGGKKWRETK